MSGTLLNELEWNWVEGISLLYPIRQFFRIVVKNLTHLTKPACSRAASSGSIQYGNALVGG